MASIFHSCECWDNKSDTFRFWFSNLGGPIGLSGKVRDSQGSSQTLMSSPEPTTHPSWVHRTSRPAKIPLHPWEMEFEGSTVIKSEEWQYLPRRILASEEYGFLRIRHAVFASRASLNFSISRNPNLPADLGRVKLSHETQANFCKEGLTSHQKCVRIDWICSHKETGSLKHAIL